MVKNRSFYEKSAKKRKNMPILKIPAQNFKETPFFYKKPKNCIHPPNRRCALQPCVTVSALYSTHILVSGRRARGGGGGGGAGGLSFLPRLSKYAKNEFAKISVDMMKT